MIATDSGAQVEREMIRSMAVADPVMGMWLAFSQVEAALVRLATLAGLTATTALAAAPRLRDLGVLPGDLEKICNEHRQTLSRARTAENRGEPIRASFVDWYLDTAFKLADYVLELEPRATAAA